MGLAHHADAEREWAYDCEPKIGRLDNAFDDANKYGWIVVGMALDWKITLPAEQK